MKNAIILCYGGLDSVVTAYLAKKKFKYDKIKILFFDYGQKSLKLERKCSKNCARELNAELIEIKLNIKKCIAGNLINNGPGKRWRQKNLKDTSVESEKWYLPHRNLIFLSYALAFAESKNIKDIFVGFKNEGKEPYPDATKIFLDKLNSLETEFKKGILISAPLIKKDKEDIILIGKELGVNLGGTCSCYAPQNEKHCGSCLACRLRKAGFYWADMKDPTVYQM